MKIELSTPKDRLKKTARRCRFWGWVFLPGGLIGCVSGSVSGVFLLVFGGWLFLRQKKAEDTMMQQGVAIEAQRQAEAEAAKKQKEEEARQARIAEEEEEWRRFLSENEHVRTIHTKVVGVTYRNSDGSSRQENLSYCVDGSPVEFRYFPYKGAPAYAVFCCGDQIGNLSADLALDLYELPDTYTFMGEIDEVTGGEDGLKYGCNLRIELYREK